LRLLRSRTGRCGDPTPSPQVPGVRRIRVFDLVPSTAPTTGQALQAVFVQQFGQMTGRGRFGYFGDGLVLSRTDAVLEASFAAIEQAIQYLCLLGR